MTQRWGYARCSTLDQTTASQIDALRAAGCGTIVEEIGSGADRNRPALAELLETIKSGETLVVVRLDRVARSLTHLLAVLETLKGKGCFFKSLSDPVDTASPAGIFVLQVIGAVAEFERALIMERTRDGVRAAMARGKKPGNPGVRERRPRALAKIAKTKAENYDAEVAASAPSWLPIVKALRPRHSWEEITRITNASPRVSQQFTHDRLQRFSKVAVSHGMLHHAVLKKTRQASPAARLAMLVRTMVSSGLIPIWFDSPEMMLTRMGERTPNGSSTWTKAGISRLLAEKSPRRKAWRNKMMGEPALLMGADSLPTGIIDA
jgi:DNA invertase Pin-like site-specific DNA recombinase